MSLTTLVTTITQTAQDVASTASTMATTIQTLDTYVNQAFDAYETTFNTSVSNTRNTFSSYTSTAKQTCDTVHTFSSHIASYQSFSTTYTATTFSEGVQTLRDEGLTSVANILDGTDSWLWKDRVASLEQYAAENTLSENQRDAISHVVDQNSYLQSHHPDMYSQVQDVINA